MDNVMDKKISEITESETRLDENFIALKSAYRTGNGDPEALIELVKEAMGKRSQRKFAADMGVNVSSISRIVNGKVSEISDALLAKIAANAEPDSGVTMEKLMQAQGMVAAKSRAQLASKYEESCRRILADELLKRGYSVNYPMERIYPNRYVCDFEVVTDALTNGGGRWLVETKMMSQYAPLPTGSGKTGIWMDSAMAVYYREETVGRISLMVDRRTMFEQMKDRWNKLVIKDEISIILISVGEGKILDEFILPMKEGKKPMFTFKAEREKGDM